MKCKNFKYFEIVLFLKKLAMFFMPLNFFGACAKRISMT